MPYARFEKLALEKRERLLDIAAQDFARYGFEDASVNRILERAQMSKGAAYYYFEDKADLFFTVVQYASERLKLIDLRVNVNELDETNYWTTFADVHRQPLLRSYERPWLFAAIRAAGRLSPEMLQREPLASLARQITSLAMSVLKRGQQLGLVRTDLTDELLFAWIEGLDSASDQWLVVRWEQLDPETIGQISDQTVDAMRRVLAPH